MLRFLTRPRWLAWHAALVAVLVTFTWLGSWQLGSFEHRGRSAADRPAVALDRLSTPGGRVAGGDVDRRVVARGSYDAARTLLVPGRELDGRRGFLVLTPFRTSTGILPVVRGWVPRAGDPATRPPSGTVRLTGRLQASESREASRVDPLASLPSGRLPYVATVALLQEWPYPPAQIHDGYAVAAGEVPAAAAVPERWPAQRTSGGVARWRNLAYALQWWLFAGAAVFFWGSVLRRAWRDEHPPPGTSSPAPAVDVEV